MRLPFLVLTPACLSPALAFVYMQQPPFDYMLAVIILAAALCAHISVNMFNEYLDFHSGLDAMTTRTPISGGSGALIASPEAAGKVLAGACASLLLTLIAGVYFITSIGAAILPVGLMGVIIILTYTQWINSNPLLCLIAPGLALGPLMSCGTVFVMTGNYHVSAFMLSMPLFFMLNNLLLLNQLPDIDADRFAGRRHLMIEYGFDTGIKVYILFAGLAALSLLLTVAGDSLPVSSLPTLIPIAAGVFAVAQVRRRLRSKQDLSPALGLNILACTLTPVFIATGILVS